MKYLTIIIILSITLTGCSSLKKEALNNKPDEIYVIAKQYLQDRNWKQAITKLEELDNSYPLFSYTQQVQLDLIYLYYKNSDFQLAQTIIDRFIRLNPIHPNIDYVIYIRGLIKVAMDNKKQIFFKTDHSELDPQYAIDAFNDFSQLIHNYPNSPYITDATQYIKLLKNRLAKYELSIANYYMRRGAWIAVINRIKNILNDYPDTQVIYDGLKLMEKAYRQIQMDTQANEIKRLIISNSKNTNLSKIGNY